MTKRRLIDLFYRVGRRGLILGFLGFVALVVGLGSVGAPPTPQALANAQVIRKIAPMVVWYWLWTVSGVLCTLGVFWHCFRTYAVGTFSFLCFVFGLGYLAAMGLNGTFRPWIAAILYGGFGMLMLVIAGWPEAPRKGDPR